VNSHLLQAHGSFVFRGVVRPIPETLAALLAAVCAPEPDVEAWQAFETISTHECGSGVDAFLAASLTESLKRLPAESRAATIRAVGGLLAEHCSFPGPVLQRLAASPDLPARRLAWSLAELAPSLLTGEVLDGLLRGMRSQQAIDTLRRLERRVGPNPAVQEALREREQNLRIRCSRCGAESRRPDMIQHLWTAHGLVLDGRRVRLKGAGLPGLSDGRLRSL